MGLVVDYLGWYIVSTQYDHGFKTSSAEFLNHFELKFEVVQSGSMDH